VINDDRVLIVNAKEIASLTIRHQIPAIAQPEFAAFDRNAVRPLVQHHP
jgi:hypothetical protein